MTLLTALPLVGIALARPAAAQDHLPKPRPTQARSQVNPAPRARGDAQNRGFMGADYLFGVTDGNRSWDRTPYSRVGDQTLASPLELDGNIFPYPLRDGRRFRLQRPVVDELNPGIALSEEGTLVLPPVGVLPDPGAVAIGAAWNSAPGGFVAGPSIGFRGAGYRRAVARPRTATTPNSDPTDPSKIVWYPRVPGAPGSFTRYAIRVHIPEPGDTTEGRLSDARYLVYYVVPVGTNRFIPKRKVCFVAQDSAGDKFLVGDDGRPAYFPLLSDATYAVGGLNYETGEPISAQSLHARVELDSSTENVGANLFVVADQIEFVQRPASIQAAPTLTPQHGGRKVARPQTPTPADPYKQPAAGANYAANPLVVPAGGGFPGGIASPNDSFDFVNSPHDPVYLGATPSAVLDRGDPSVLFQGPVSLIDPRDGANAVATVDATNHQSYRDASNNIVPFFSQVQVLVPRTEFLPDPETGVRNDLKDGTRTIEVGSVLALDWLTSTVIWRFPDRSFLPEGTVNPNGSAIAVAGLRNKRIGTGPLGSLFQVPGIGAYDRNGNGVFDDDEVFLVGQGGNPSGGIASSITIAHSINVLGRALIPVYDSSNNQMNGVTEAPIERYSRLDPANPARRIAVQTSVAYVAANNGVLYALDPFGNNDNRYFENADPTRLGAFRNGTTNVLWTFSPPSAPRILSGTRRETLGQYYQRLKTEVPVPGPFGGSTPVVAWARADDDTLLNPATEEPRLFVGNQNGVLYALDARADARFSDTLGLPNALPFRKGEQTYNANYPTGVPETPLLAQYRVELKWWFETLGAISAAPAVSLTPHNHPTLAGGSRGVYVSTTEGRVYCLDWHGPVTRSDAAHADNMTWTGVGGGEAPGSPPAGSAAALNDNLRFHNDNPANSLARPDLTEGAIRPRWAFPNRYRNIRGGTARTRTQPPDLSLAFPSNRLAEPFTSSAPLRSAPVLMDFPYLDPDVPGLSGVRRYVVVATNDYNADEPENPKVGRLLLLDQEGDRRDFLTNPAPTVATAKAVAPTKPVPAVSARIYSQPLDQFISRVGPFGQAAPAWAYRSVYDQYDASGKALIARRNEPSTTAGTVYPARRPLPTLFVGGVGRLYAIDIDEKTGLLLRWRPDGVAQPTPLPAGFVVPGPEARSDLLNPNDPVNNPANPILNVGAKESLKNRRILARTLPLQGDPSPVDGSLVVTGGPLQNRSNATAKTAADALGTDAFNKTVGQSGPPFVPLLPTDDAPSAKSVPGLTQAPLPPPTYPPFGYDLTLPAASRVLPVFDLTGRYVNQDVDDPLTTTRGAFPEGFDAAANQANIAYQYPALLATTQGGFLHEVSTNIEGEQTLSGGETATLGWALVDGDLNAFNPRHALFFTKLGPGGAGGGIAVFTNAYFASRDPGFSRRTGRLYPDGEPNADASIFSDGPRPHLKPRPLFRGNPSATPVRLAADDHTGRTGFPLDLNGLFYDKRFAKNAAPAHNNTAGGLRLPGYSQQGAFFSDGVVTGTPVSDQERHLRFLAPSTDRDDSYINDNPAGHRVAWIYAGGEDGILYSYTPVFTFRLGGQNSGLAAGVNITRNDPGATVPRVDIFDADDFAELLRAARTGNVERPDRDGTQTGIGVTGKRRSRAAKGGKNVFEWGESVYLVIWDVTVRSPYPKGQPEPALPGSFSVNLTITAQGGASLTRTIPLERAGAQLATYPYERGYMVPDTLAPDFEANFESAQLGIGFYELKLDGRSGLPQTPGTQISVAVSQDYPQSNIPVNQRATGGRQVVIVAGGAVEAERMTNFAPVFMTANPLGVQGFVADTHDQGFPASAANSGGLRANGIGPFVTPNPQDNAQVKQRVASTGNSTGANDPNRSGFEYSQALAQGNQIIRVDLNPYANPGADALQRNPRFLQRIKDETGGDDPVYYIPVVAGSGYIAHGRTGSTDLTNLQRNLRIANRSMLSSLNRVRTEPMGDLIWRWWPGAIPNADATEAGGANPRRTPGGMGVDGRINPLPWETPVIEPQPWKAGAPSAPAGTLLAGGNLSPDYPDISLTGNRESLSVTLAGGDAMLGGITLPNAQLSVTPNPDGIVNPLSTQSGPFAAALAVRVPAFQPANLVAMHSLTSTYIAPSVEDGAQSFVGDGPVQLPRGLANRQLRTLGSGAFDGGATIAPFGYTARVRVFVDLNNNGIWDRDEAFRVVEVWVGVPADLGLKSTESPVDLGALPAGFGIQNGLLGYGQGIAPFQSGFLPSPLAAGGLLPPYEPFFKRFTIQNTGNVNLWNLRASQKVEAPPFAPGRPSGDLGTGQSFYYFGLKSATVEGRFGILSAGADPNPGLVVPNVMPQVVTSIDRAFDGAWTAIYQATPWMQADSGDGTSVYQRYYLPFAGRHTLHKARPGSSTPSVLGLPDLPASQTLVDSANLPAGVDPPNSGAPLVGVAVPVGTPAGVYQSAFSAIAGAPPMLSVFEDHDTGQPYQATPILQGNGTISPAGPLYAGRNTFDLADPSTFPGNNPVTPNEQTVLRIRRTASDGTNLIGYEYQPHSNPAIDLKVTVGETALTGQIADFALPNPLAGLTGIFSGLLPQVDGAPLLDGGRPASALAPAAYRSANGRLHLYFVRNVSASTGLASTAAGAPLKLFHSHLGWDPALGTWIADNPGEPIDNPASNADAVKGGRWFSLPQPVTTTAGPGEVSESNVSPFVLQASPFAGRATLLFLNMQPSGGGALHTLYFARLDDNGVPSGVETFVANADPNLRRYSPRAVFDPGILTTIALFHGGTPGQFKLYYSPRAADAEGVPSGTKPDGASGRPVEFAVPLPAAFASTREASGVVRRLAAVGGGATPVVDIYFTATLRGAQASDLYLSRFRIDGTGTQARLTPLTLPVIVQEELKQEGRDLAWKGRHIAWNRNLDVPAALPLVYVNDRTAPFTDPARWQYDAATQVLFQIVPRPGGVLYVYVDTAAGTVRFRGRGAPSSRDRVFATYQPQTYRLTPDVDSDAGGLAFVDARVLRATTEANGLTRGVIRRPVNVPLGRQWLLWQKGRALYQASRRVGVDLKSAYTLNALAAGESLALGAPDASGNQAIVGLSVSIDGIGPVAYDADATNGRIYVDPVYEGLTLRVAYRAFNEATRGTRDSEAAGVLGLIDELAATDADSIGVAIPMVRSVNEGQVYGFVDLYNYDPATFGIGAAGSGRTNPAPAGDPVLQPGRVWMFWSSPRGRIGKVPAGANLLETLPSGFDLLYQTLAPDFDHPTLPGR